jgi:hypothetical protein
MSLFFSEKAKIGDIGGKLLKQKNIKNRKILKKIRKFLFFYFLSIIF